MRRTPVEEAAHSSRLVRFGTFEVDLAAGEVRKSGLKLKLTGQPFQVLAMLLERPGEVVTREELQKRLWPDTFVDVDHNLNIAINKIREMLADSAESPRFVETLPRRGYRFIAPVSGTGQPSAAEAKPTGRPGLRAGSLEALAVIAMVTVLLGLNVGGWRNRIFARYVNPPVQALAVLPLENLSHDPEQEYFADGITVALIADLGRVRRPRVISRQSVMRYKDTRKSLQEIGKELNVDAVLEGTVERSGDRVRVTVRLDQVSPETQLWANKYDRSLRDVLALQDEIARAVADEARVALTPQERDILASAQAVDPQAHDDYLRGQYFINRNTEPDMQTSIGYFKRSIAKDPGYARAYAGLSDAYGRLTTVWMPVYPKEMLALQKAAALKSVEIDPSLAEGHVQLAWALAQEWNWLDAEKEARMAITLSPNYADAHNMYSQYLSAVGRNDEAFSQINYAIELDPLNSDYKHELGWTAYRARQYDFAEHQFKSLEDGFGLAAVYAGRKMYPEVIAAIQGSIDRYGRKPVFLSGQAWAYGSAGNKREATKLLSELKEMAQHQYVSPTLLADAYLGIGDKDKALAWLERGCEDHDGWGWYYKINPVYDPLRSEPRFQTLLRRMNFQE
jgi:TolB-like protein/DNA-binding winged helix-turn-helix (wHTH) protein/Flp pilus assembly protein TadD